LPDQEGKEEKGDVMEYTVIMVSHGRNYQETMNLLIEEVNRYIKEGWKPLGGVANVGASLVQAMIREQG